MKTQKSITPGIKNDPIYITCGVSQCFYREHGAVLVSFFQKHLSTWHIGLYLFEQLLLFIFIVDTISNGSRYTSGSIDCILPSRYFTEEEKNWEPCTNWLSAIEKKLFLLEICIHV